MHAPPSLIPRAFARRLPVPVCATPHLAQSRILFFGSHRPCSPRGVASFASTATSRRAVVTSRKSLDSFGRCLRQSSSFSTTSRVSNQRRYIAFGSAFGVVVLILSSAVYAVQTSHEASVALDDIIEIEDEMSAEVLPGRIGNLTPEQEEKLRQFWQLVFKVCGVEAEEKENGAPLGGSPEVTRTDTGDGKKQKKKRMGLFSRKGKKEASETESAASSVIAPAKEGEEDKYGQTKHFHDTLASQSPEFIRVTMWNMVKHDHPDALALRFLRARKWDIEKALVMLVSTLNWRANDMHVDDDIMANGEGYALEAENDADPKKRTLNHDFLAQMRMGKSFVHGADKHGRPICLVRVRLHKQGEQTEEALERYTVHLIEISRLLLKQPADTGTILFDMTGFSMANMDYTPVKFMIRCFEANYPESLGVVLVHKAPWIFQGIWKIIKGWLDPVVANKVNFTNNKKDLEEFIEPSKIIKELDGDEDWEYSYVEPQPGENDKMKDTATRDQLLAARDLMYKEYEEATLEWINNHEGDKGAEIKAKRNAIAAKLREGYWALDPYIRSRTFYDRIGVLQQGGKIDYYPKPAAVEPAISEKAAETSAVAPAAVPVSTTADDID